MTKVQWAMVLDATCPGLSSSPCDFGQPMDPEFVSFLNSSFIMKASRPLYVGDLYAKLPRESDVLVLGPVVGEPDLRVLSLRRGFDAICQRGGKSMGASLFIRAPLDVPLRVDGEAVYQLLKEGLAHMDSFRSPTGQLDVPASKMAFSFVPSQELVRALEGMEVSSEPMRTAPPITIVDASHRQCITRRTPLMGRFIEQELGTARGKSLLFSDSHSFVQAVGGDKEVYDQRAYASAKVAAKGPVAVQTEENPNDSARPETAGAAPSDKGKPANQFGPAAEALLDAIAQVAAADPAFREAALARLRNPAPKGEKAML